MNIIKYELRKVFTSPMILSFIIGLIAFNGILVMSRFHSRSEMRPITENVQQVGANINSESLAYWQYQLDKNLIYEDMSSYIDVAVNAREIFASNKMIDRGEMVIAQIQAESTLAETIRTQYALAQDRFEAVLENGSYDYFFFDGHIHQTMSFLLNVVLKPTAIGVALLGALISAYLIGYEFDVKSAYVTYTTKVGRQLQIKKMIAINIAITVIYLLIMGITLLIYFTIYDYSGLWQVPMHSVYMSEQRFTAVFWWDLQFWQYLLAVVLVLWFVQLILVALIFTLSKVTRNSFLLVFVFVGTVGLIYLIPSLMPRTSSWLAYSTFNPATILFNLQNTFQVDNMFPHFESLTFGIWGLCLFISGYFTHQSFKKLDL